jgi:hypothetical protein
MYDFEGKQTNAHLDRQPVGEINVQKTDLTEVFSNQTPRVEMPTNKIVKPQAQILIIPMGILVIAWAVNFFNQLRFQNPGGKKLNTIKGKKGKGCHPIHCSNCRFFKNEPYLKCAVHPWKVGSIEAINCSDFWPLDSGKFYHHPEEV